MFPEMNRSTRARRGWGLGAVVLVAALLLGCDTNSAPPVDPAATATAQAADAATITARQQTVQTFTAGENATATAGLALLAQLATRVQVDLADGGPVTVAGVQRTAIKITVTNHDQAAHQVVIRVYDKAAPLESQVYAVGGPLTVAAGGTASTTVDFARPFAAAASQIQQIDGLVDYGPPTH